MLRFICYCFISHKAHNVYRNRSFTIENKAAVDATKLPLPLGLLKCQDPPHVGGHAGNGRAEGCMRELPLRTALTAKGDTSHFASCTIYMLGIVALANGVMRDPQTRLNPRCVPNVAYFDEGRGVNHAFATFEPRRMCVRASCFARRER